MNKNSINNKTIVNTTFQLIIVISVALFMFSGCTDTIDGEVNANIKPIVQFVNIPPEGQQFSRNPEIYWIGTDPDGLIDYYRYYIALKSSVDSAVSIDSYALAISDADWNQIDVVQTESDPKTTNILPLTADTLDPVSNAVQQYVFLQAFDRENLGSDIKYRLFGRNDNPPETQIFNIGNDTPFVNSVFEGGIVTGVRFRWAGFDRKDYDDIGLTPPPFDFEWRLYGPFYKDSINYINANMIEDVFVTVDAQVLRVDDLFITCSTVETDTIIDGNPTTIPVEVCDTILFDQLFFDTATSSPFYTREQILDIEDPMIDSMYVTSSFNGVDEWIQNEADTLYNVYRNGAPDTTIEMNFIFWARSRDDAFVKDLTPEFVSFPVINPKYERDVAIIDFTKASGLTQNNAKYMHIDTAKAYWHNTIHEWGNSKGYNIVFDTSVFDSTEASPQQAGKTGIDYIHTVRYSTGIPLNILLKHKIIVLYNENFDRSGFAQDASTNYPEILSAMDAGINVWATWRNPLNVRLNGAPFQIVIAPVDDYTRYFGVEFMTYSNWFSNGFTPGGNPDDLFRNEDFVGTYSVDEAEWPSLAIDTALLHSRLHWYDITASPFKPYMQWEDSLAALPEVNWAARSFGTEVMYLYKSKYGANHPSGLEYEGSPVGHRFQTNLFRSVHFTFTMLSVDSTQGQNIANSVFDWLYNPALSGSVVEEDRYNDALQRISIDDARQKYGQRLIEQGELRLKQQSGN